MKARLKLRKAKEGAFVSLTKDYLPILFPYGIMNNIRRNYGLQVRI